MNIIIGILGIITTLIVGTFYLLFRYERNSRKNEAVSVGNNFSHYSGNKALSAAAYAAMKNNGVNNEEKSITDKASSEDVLKSFSMKNTKSIKKLANCD